MLCGAKAQRIQTAGGIVEPKGAKGAGTRLRRCDDPHVLDAPQRTNKFCFVRVGEPCDT